MQLRNSNWCEEQARGVFDARLCMRFVPTRFVALAFLGIIANQEVRILQGSPFGSHCCVFMKCNFGWRSLQSWLRPSALLFCLAAVFAYNCLVLGVAQEDQPHGQDVIATRPTDERLLVCGRNGLFVLLRLYNCNIKFQDILREVPVSSKGTSLLDLKNSSYRLGVRARVCRLTLAQAMSCTRPFLAYFEVKGLSNQTGHFIVVADYDPKRDAFLTLDGETGSRYWLESSKFETRWTGHVLISQSTGNGVSRVIRFLFVVAIVSLVVRFWAHKNGKII